MLSSYKKKDDVAGKDKDEGWLTNCYGPFNAFKAFFEFPVSAI